jgi:hypothetical protein
MDKNNTCFLRLLGDVLCESVAALIILLPGFALGMVTIMIYNGMNRYQMRNMLTRLFADPIMSDVLVSLLCISIIFGVAQVTLYTTNRKSE